MAIRFHYGDKSVLVETSHHNTMQKEIDAEFKSYLDSLSPTSVRNRISNALAQSAENDHRLEELRNPKPVKKEGFFSSVINGFFH